MLSERANGVLLPISSLPGATGIGTLGREAYEAAGYLAKASQRYWQVLPVGPTGFGDSPYQSFSTFAGNPYFIDFDMLCDEGYLKKSDYENIVWSKHPRRVCYGKLYTERAKVFARLQKNFDARLPPGFDEFCGASSAWLDDYALFMAVKDAHRGASFGTWEDSIRRRTPAALDSWRKKEASRVRYYKMLQYFFFKQWTAFKAHANRAGLKIIGDVPIYVAADSADAWACPEAFSLDSDLRPVEVAGCPPDYFSEDGQLWGNPVYNWKYLKETGYEWWRRRLESALSMYDIVRIDHFRGFDEYYCIPYGAKNAKTGEWRPGPGLDFFRALESRIPGMAGSVIAEDLGLLTDSVRAMLRASLFPGMKVLQFAFDDPQSDYLPFRYDKNCVVYTGTHDNDTILGWIKSAPPATLERARAYLRAKTPEVLAREMMLAAMSSVADTCILTMQDLMGLGKNARMNTPSTLGGNWMWRASKAQFTPEAQEFLARYTALYGRVVKDDGTGRAESAAGGAANGG